MPLLSNVFAVFAEQHPQFVTELAPYLKLEYYGEGMVWNGDGKSACRCTCTALVLCTANVRISLLGDVILRQGFYGRELYFVARGSVEVRVRFPKLCAPDAQSKTQMHSREDMILEIAWIIHIDLMADVSEVCLHNGSWHYMYAKAAIPPSMCTPWVALTPV
jgi:hypothetical protein